MVALDLRDIFARLVQTIATEVPNAAVLESTLDLDFSQSRVVRMKSALAIHDARLKFCGIDADIVWGDAPHRQIMVLMKSSPLRYQDVKGDMFGADQRTVPSKLSPGFAVILEIDGWTCGYTVDAPDATVSTVFCETKRNEARITAPFFMR